MASTTPQAPQTSVAVGAEQRTQANPPMPLHVAGRTRGQTCVGNTRQRSGLKQHAQSIHCHVKLEQHSLGIVHLKGH